VCFGVACVCDVSKYVCVLGQKYLLYIGLY